MIGESRGCYLFMWHLLTRRLPRRSGTLYRYVKWILCATSPMDVIHFSQVGSSGIRTLSTTSAPLSMGQILEVLLGKAKAEAEEAQVNREG